MATTTSTKTVQMSDGYLYRPRVVRLFDGALSSGSTYQKIVDTRHYRAGRVTVKVGAKSSDSTVAFYVTTNDSSAAGRIVDTSSGAQSITISTTVSDWHIFHGLDHFSAFSVNIAGGGGATDISMDVELV